MYAYCVLLFAHILDLMVLYLFPSKKTRFSISLFLLSFVILFTLIGSKTTLSWSCFVLYAPQKYLYLEIYWLLVSICMFAETCKPASHWFQLGQCLCAALTLKWSVLSLNYILLFDLFLLVNISKFVAVLWLCWFYFFLDYSLLHHLYHHLL